MASDERSCVATVDRCVGEAIGLDAVVYSTAIDLLTHLTDATAETWADVRDERHGAALIDAALPHLRATDSRAVYISASSVDRPLPGMGVCVQQGGAGDDGSRLAGRASGRGASPSPGRLGARHRRHPAS